MTPQFLNRPEIVPSVEALIGSTPIVALRPQTLGVPARVTAKLDFFNPGGSSKDRIATFMINEAERQGLLVPGGTIIEPTSGNTGVGLGIVAAQRGYKAVFVVTNKVGQEKVDRLKQYGEVHICEVALPPEHPDSYYSVARRLTEETPNSFRPDQYSNPFNPRAHYETTGPEIWEQTGGRITHFVAGMGTGGTISGVGKYLKEQFPDIVIVGADPDNSVYSGGTGRPYLVEGVGEDFFPDTFDPNVVDLMIPVSDKDAFLFAREFTRKEGLSIGGSGALALVAAQRIPDLKETDLVVVFLPDSGVLYLSTIYNDQWMLERGFIDEELETGDRISALNNSAVKEFGPHSFASINVDRTVREALAIMHEGGYSQLPVVVRGQQAPFANAEIIGSVSARELMEQITDNPAFLDSEVEKVLSPRLPTVGIGESVKTAAQRLRETDALLVLDGGLPVGVITQTDINNHLSHRIEPLQRGLGIQ